MIVENSIVLHCFDWVDIFVQNWFELLDVISVDLKMHKSMTESCLTIGQLQKEIGSI